jgi:hypothetical protein
MTAPARYQPGISVQQSNPFDEDGQGSLVEESDRTEPADASVTHLEAAEEELVGRPGDESVYSSTEKKRTRRRGNKIPATIPGACAASSIVGQKDFCERATSIEALSPLATQIVPACIAESEQPSTDQDQMNADNFAVRRDEGVSVESIGPSLVECAFRTSTNEQLEQPDAGNRSAIDQQSSGLLTPEAREYIAECKKRAVSNTDGSEAALPTPDQVSARLKR